MQRTQRPESCTDDEGHEDKSRAALDPRVLLREIGDELSQGSREVCGGQSADSEAQDCRTLNPQRRRV